MHKIFHQQTKNVSPTDQVPPPRHSREGGNPVPCFSERRAQATRVLPF